MKISVDLRSKDYDEWNDPKNGFMFEWEYPILPHKKDFIDMNIFGDFVPEHIRPFFNERPWFVWVITWRLIKNEMIPTITLTDWENALR